MTDTHIKINAVPPKVQYTGNGSTTVFPYEFPIFDDSDMVVYFDDEVQESGYTVSGAGQTEGGNVTFDTAPDDGVKITLYRNIPIERITDFQEGGTFRPKNLNDEFDRQTAFLQQVQETLDRSVKVGVTSDVDPEAVLTEVERLYESIDNVDAVADDLTNIDAVAGDLTNIDAVAGNESNINTVAGISSDVSSVAGAAADIGTVATNMSGVNNCAANMSAIQDAPNQAASAAASAEAAAQSAAVANPPPLLTHLWADHLLNDVRYLRADTFSWQSGVVYVAAYNHLVADIDGKTATSETIGSYTISYYLADDGHKITTDETTVDNIHNESGVAWYYILDTTNQRFKLPRTKYGFAGLRDAVGKYVPESLPNIKGSVSTYASISTQTSASGCFTTSTDAQGNVSTTSGNGRIQHINISASRSSSAYQDNAPVQERATQMYLYFYVGQFTQTATEQTAGLNSELFNGKVDLNAANLSTAGKSLISGLGMPSDRYIDLTLLASGAEYTAPANGYVAIEKQSNGSNQYVGIWTDYYASFSLFSATSELHRCFIPIQKGRTFVVGYTASGSLGYFRFIYAEGEPNV